MITLGQLVMKFHISLWKFMEGSLASYQPTLKILLNTAAQQDPVSLLPSKLNCAAISWMVFPAIYFQTNAQVFSHL